MTPPSSQTYTQILKSTMLMGGASLVNVALSIVRNKAMAVLLGPEGIGLMGLYSSIVDIAASIAGLGVGGSGVRQVAEAAGTGDAARIAQSATVLRRISVVLALLGALFLAALAYPVSRFTFGDYQHVGGIVLLSLAVFFRLVSAGQSALIQGMSPVFCGDLQVQWPPLFLQTAIWARFIERNRADLRFNVAVHVPRGAACETGRPTAGGGRWV